MYDGIRNAGGHRYYIVRLDCISIDLKEEDLIVESGDWSVAARIGQADRRTCQVDETPRNPDGEAGSGVRSEKQR